MNTIQLEKESSKKYLLEKDTDDLVALTSDNVARVEAMISSDSNYLKSEDKTAEPHGSYGGSTAFWMSELKKYLISGSEKSKYSYKEVVLEAVSAVDRENNTHINADGVGRNELSDRIASLLKDDLVTLLKDPAPEYKLVSILSKKTHPLGNKMRARENYSFATKFCHYACMYVFEGSKEQDNFSIYDYVISSVLPLYITKYLKISSKKSDFLKYGEYIDIIDKIIKKSGGKISRNGFDHILWYYYKGKPINNK